MPVTINELKKEKKRIILDIIFDNVLPVAGNIYWGLDMLTSAIRNNNIDKSMHISKFEVKRIMSKLAERITNTITIHIIDNIIYFKFNP